MGAFFEAFDVNLVGLGFQVFNFLLLLYLLNRLMFKPLLARMDERSAKIEKGLEDAEAAARDRELARAEREAAVSEARKEAAEMIARANKIAEDTRDVRVYAIQGGYLMDFEIALKAVGGPLKWGDTKEGNERL